MNYKITAPIQGTGQALVYVDPSGDPRVHALGLEVIAIVQQAEARVVASDDDVHGATESIALIAGLKKAFEEKRKEYTAPLNGYLKDINAAFKEYTAPLDGADKVTRSKWKWEVEDISKVPPEYIIVDAAKLGKVVRAGLHSIPGIRIWQEEGLRASAPK